MAVKSSADDPMDLGPFLQNYVMKNPFKAAGAAATTVDGRASGDRSSRGSTPRVGGSWPRLTAVLRARRRGGRSCVLNGVGNHTVSAQAADPPLDNAETGRDSDVTAWLRENYRYMSGPGRHRTVSQHLLLRVQQVFPDVTGDTIHNFVMAAFPGCTKFINKKNGLAFYQGLVTRPDPEVYENPLFTAALDSVTSQLLTTSQAAEKFGVRESALIAALSWCDVEKSSGDVPTSNAVTVSTGSSQSDVILSKSGHKRAYLSDSLDDPQCRRYRSSVDDAVDFEMMLQDVSSCGENSKSDHPVSQPLLASSRALPQEFVTIKSEPENDSSNEQPVELQPLNFSLSVNSSQNTTAASAVNGPQTHANDVSIGSASPDAAASSADNCSDSDVGQLHKELASATAANLALQEELNARDFHLAQLAEDFFCLHEQFKQLARHFQAVLGDIQPLSDQSAVSRITHNHAS